MLAVDLGGTRVKVGRVSGGVPSDVVVADHGGGPLPGVLARLAGLLDEVAPEGADRVGMCVPGVVDDAGVVVALPGKLPGAVGADLVGWLQGRTGGRARVVNDAIAYGVGEAAGESGRTLVVTIGTGVGTCVVEDGRPLGAGPLGGGQLGGQLPLTADGPLDTSGRPGTIEAWCRAERVLAEVRAAGLDAPDVAAACRAALAGDPRALQGISSYQGWLARGLAALCLAYTPDLVVVGGGPLAEPALFLDGLEEQVQPLLWPGQGVRLRGARHGDAAALVGLEVLAG